MIGMQVPGKRYHGSLSFKVRSRAGVESSVLKHVAYRLRNDHGKSGFRPRDLAALAAIAVIADEGIFHDFPGSCFCA